MTLELINQLVEQRFALTKIINGAKARLASENTSLSYGTCYDIVCNGSSDKVQFNSDFTGLYFPLSLVITCTNDNSVHKKMQSVDNADVKAFVWLCHKNEVSISLESNGFSKTWIVFTGRYRDKTPDEMLEYEKLIQETFPASREFSFVRERK